MTRTEWEAFREQMLANAAHTRALAEKARAALRKNGRRESQA
ncbi:MAG TPA: hypothetical protein VN770_03335 [Gaiellaceae bacterium]|nr:hypothetical protein [Gaiellaceae bacterium]